VHDGDSLRIADRVHIMVDISDDTNIIQRRAEVTGVVRRRRWSAGEKGRIVAEAIVPGAVVAEVAQSASLAIPKLRTASRWFIHISLGEACDSQPAKPM
jgi:hypothetical protein